MHDIAPLIYDLALMLGVASIVTLLFQRIRQPVVLGYLVAGVIIGPYTPPHALVNDIPNIRLLSELGVIFLMFSLGLEFSFRKLTRVGFSASTTGFIEVILMVTIGFLLGKVFGWTFYDCLFLGAALSISSTTIIIKAIEELDLKAKHFAELIFGILIVEDLLAILLLAALSTVVLTNNVFSLSMGAATLKLIIVVVGWFVIGYFLVPPLFRKIADYISQETLTIVSIALCLFLVCVAANFNYSTALGAFIMGSILAETVLIDRIHEVIKPIRDIFAAVFFISVGMLINPTIIIEQWPVVLIISLVTILGKIFTTGVGALLTGQTLPTSTRVGFGMAQIGEFSFIIIALGLSLNVISDSLYPIIVAVSGITTFTTPYLIRFSGYISGNVEKYLPKQTEHFLKVYSAWVQRFLSDSGNESILQIILMRLFINGIMVAIIFTFVDQWIFSKLIPFIQDELLTNTICLFIALGIASPFVWGMLFSSKMLTQKMVRPVIFLVWFVTLSEIGVLSIIYFDTWITFLLFILITVMFVFVSYRFLEKSYHWFERQLLRNIKKKHEKK